MAISPRITDASDEIQSSRMNQYLVTIGQELALLNLRGPGGTINNNQKPLNFDAIWVLYVSNATPDTEDTVPHSLGRIPVGILVGIPDKAAVVYDSGTDWTTTNLFLKVDTATVTVNIMVF